MKACLLHLQQRFDVAERFEQTVFLPFSDFGADIRDFALDPNGRTLLTLYAAPFDDYPVILVADLDDPTPLLTLHSLEFPSLSRIEGLIVDGGKTPS